MKNNLEDEIRDWLENGNLPKHDNYNDDDIRETARHFAEWTKKNPDKQNIVKYLKELGYTVTLNGDVITREQELKDMEQYVKYQEEKLIEKACEWLRCNTYGYLVEKYGEVDLDREKPIDDFKKAMMEE